MSSVFLHNKAITAASKQESQQFTDVVKRLNMLRPARYPRSGEAGPGLTSYVASWSAANYFKDWLPFNLADEGGSNTATAAFGAFTTAPDATTDTARLLKDTTANSQHSFIAGWNNVNQPYYGKLRLAGIFKVAGRSRVVLEMSSQPANTGGVGKIGCKAVFDLAGGRVAVDTAAFGSPTNVWTLFPAKIFSQGGGWYLCYFDAIAGTSPAPMGLFGKLYLDNGTGLAAESSTYVGDGSSGVYGWRSNMLPTRSWNLHTVSFFDDFNDNTKANIDLVNSRTEGFDWYVQNGNPAYGNGFPPTESAAIAVANSVLTLGPSAINPVGSALRTFASTWDGVTPSTGYVGKGWVIPALFECRQKWDISLSNQVDTVAFWTVSIEWLVAGFNQDPNRLIPGREYDFTEGLHGGYPRSSMLYYPAGPADPFNAPNQGIGLSATGVDVWYAEHTYQGEGVTYLGTRYQSLRQTTGDPPDSSPSDWGPFVQKNVQLLLYQAGVDLPDGDYTNFHDYATMWFPSTADEPGQVIQFYDSVMCSFPLCYGPNAATSTINPDVISQSDYQHMPVIFNSGPSMPLSIDWIRVTK